MTKFDRDELLFLLAATEPGTPLRRKLADMLAEYWQETKGQAIAARVAAKVVTALPQESTGSKALRPLLPTDRKRGEGGCAWETYGYLCPVDAIPGTDFCEGHGNKVCRNCAEPATHGCPRELQFVCGAPLCDNCRSCNGHN